MIRMKAIDVAGNISLGFAPLSVGVALGPEGEL
jgi:hypothetical protein